MPELPEVETIKNDLNQYIKNKTFQAVDVRLPKMVKANLARFIKEIKGLQVKKVKRRAKMMIFELNDHKYLLIHLKMTGQLIYCDKKTFVKGGHNLKGGELELPNKYSQVIFKFKDGSCLFFNDLRQFGWVKLVDQSGLNLEVARYGPEPLSKEFNKSALNQLLEQNQKIKLKALLMDQKKIAGLGNIYADEICFYARARPSRIIKTLTIKEREKLYQGIESILKKAIAKRGTTANNYVDANGRPGGFTQYLKVYGLAKQPCKVCKTPIKKIKLIQRGTHFCPKCQR